jgi:peptide/nickel transport system substrate-binding protein
LTPEDVVFSYDLKNKAGLYPNEPFASSSVATGPDHSVIFTLAQASPLVPKMANYYHIMSRNVLADLDPDTATFEDVSAHAGNTGEDLSLLITTGPFQLVELVRDDYMRFARYDGYWRGRPHLDEFVLRKIDDVGALTAQLQTGEIDVFGGHYDVIDPAVVADFEGSDVTVVQSEASYGAGPMISLNHRPEKTPLFQDVRVRQALLYALDRQAILDGVFFGYGTVSDSVVGIPAAFDTTAVPAPYSYDPALANQLLDEAGRALGADGIREKDGRRFQVDGYYEAGSPTYEAVVVVVQEYWRAVGIELVPSPEDASVVYERFGTGDYEVAFYVWSGNTPAFLADYFKSTSPSAEGGYGNPELDDLITAWQTEFDPDQRRALLTEIVNFIAEEVVFGIVCYQSPLGAVANRVHNYYPSPFNWFFNAHTWWVDA